MAITLQKDGARLYFLGDTYALKDRIKQLGAHWDGDRRAWWIGSAKAAEADALVKDALAPTAQFPKQASVDSDARVVAKAKYKDRLYYVLWMGRTKSGAEKARLTVLDGSIDFWVDLALCEIIKHYPPREYRGRDGAPDARRAAPLHRAPQRGEGQRRADLRRVRASRRPRDRPGRRDAEALALL